MREILLWVVMATASVTAGWWTIPLVRLLRRRAAHRPPFVLLNHRPTGANWPQRPAPGDIWLAELPYDDATGDSTERRTGACLILRSALGHVDALTITSQSRVGRPNFVEIPTRAWNPQARYNHYLEVSTPTVLPDSLLGDRAGQIDAHTWSRISRLHATGYLHRIDVEPAVSAHWFSDALRRPVADRRPGRRQA